MADRGRAIREEEGGEKSARGVDGFAESESILLHESFKCGWLSLRTIFVVSPSGGTVFEDLFASECMHVRIFILHDLSGLMFSIAMS